MSLSSIVVSKPKTSDFLGQNKITYSFVLFQMDKTPCIPLDPIISQLAHHSIDIPRESMVLEYLPTLTPFM